MSDSSIRVNPSIEEPSNWISPSSAFSNCDFGISTFLITPKMSVNCSRRNRTFSASQTLRISDFVRPGPAASNLRIFAFGILLSFFRKICKILRSFVRKATPFLQGDIENPAGLHIAVCNFLNGSDLRGPLPPIRLARWVKFGHGGDRRPLALAAGGAGPSLRVHSGGCPAASRAGRRRSHARLRAVVRRHGSRGGRAVGGRRAPPRLRLRAEPDRR